MIPVYRPDIPWLREAISGPLGSGLGARDMQIALVEDADGQARGGDADAFRQECKERGIEIHRFASQAGLPGNWNRCLQLSRGRLVHILHQDDRVRPEFYQAMAAGLEAAPDAGASFSQHVFIADDGAAIRAGHLDRPDAGLLDDWLEYVIANLAIQCPAIVVRRAVYEKLGGFDDRYDYCPDYDMWQRIATEYPLWFDPLPLAEFRVHAHSASSSRVRRVASWLEVRRCRDAAIARISPPAREPVQRSARRHAVRLAMTEAGRAIGQRDWRRSMAALGGAAAIGRLRDFVAVLRGRFDRAPVGRPPPRPPSVNAGRLPRILLITEFYPADPAKCVFGAFQRLHRHLDALSGMGPVDAVFFWAEHVLSPEEIRRQADMVKAFWPIKGSVRFIKVATGRRRPLEWIVDAFWAVRGCVGFYHTAATMRTCGREQADALRRCLYDLQPDLIFAHRLGAAAPLLRTRLPLPPVVVDIDDLEHVKLDRLAASVPRSRRRLTVLAEASLALHALRRIGKMAACMLVASEFDRSKLLSACRSAAVAVIPNTASSFVAVRKALDPVALFVGTAAYPPNREAVVWLLREIWPLVREQVPEARLLLAGEGMQQVASECPAKGVEGLGFVADLASVYQRASIALCPIRRGAGTRIKIIEAAMNSRPIVSTVLGAEGLSFAPGTEIVLDDSPAGFARACVTLLLDPNLAAAIGEAARRRAEANYAPALVAERLAALCAGLIDRSGIAGPVAVKFPDSAAAIETGQRQSRRRASR
jgi:glycosyltransferase involved in cell wall biosynthesis